jgi:hypothetical protein
VILPTTGEKSAISGSASTCTRACMRISRSWCGLRKLIDEAVLPKKST